MLTVAHGKERDLPCPLAPLLPMSVQRQVDSGSYVQRYVWVEEKYLFHTTKLQAIFFLSRIYKPLPTTSRVLLELSRERNQCRNIIPLGNVKWQQVGPSTICSTLNIKWCTTNLQWVLCMNSLLGCLFVISFLVQKNSFLQKKSFFPLLFFRAD